MIRLLDASALKGPVHESVSEQPVHIHQAGVLCAQEAEECQHWEMKTQISDAI